MSISPVSIAAQYGGLRGSPTLVIEDKGIRVRSTLPVAVYIHSDLNGVDYSQPRSLTGSFDTITILPTVHLGTKYVAVGTVQKIEYPNVIMAVANEDNTIVSE